MIQVIGRKGNGISGGVPSPSAKPSGIRFENYWSYTADQKQAYNGNGAYFVLDSDKFSGVNYRRTLFDFNDLKQYTGVKLGAFYILLEFSDSFNIGRYPEWNLNYWNGSSNIGQSGDAAQESFQRGCSTTNEVTGNFNVTYNWGSAGYLQLLKVDLSNLVGGGGVSTICRWQMKCEIALLK